jgi:hypothetical protein
MESLTIYIKDKTQIDFLCQFLQHLDFVVMPTNIKKKTVLKHKDYSIFNSAGIWANRNITQESLRAKAWKKA